VALQGVKLLRHDLFTNDVLYLELALDLRPLPPKLLPLLPLFCRCAARLAPPHLPQLSGHVLFTVVGAM
jgi:Zn-dependent M16 (insulinase) family peptidase